MALQGAVTTECCGADVVSVSLDGGRWFECAACGRTIPT